jgi:hypothetical protein
MISFKYTVLKEGETEFLVLSQHLHYDELQSGFLLFRCFAFEIFIK